MTFRQPPFFILYAYQEPIGCELLLWSISYETGAHNPEWASPILGICHGSFTNRYIFRYLVEHFFSLKMEAPLREWAHTTNKKGKLKSYYNKRSNFVLTGSCDLKYKRWDVLSSRQNRSKNKPVRENTLTQVHWSCWLRVIGSWWWDDSFEN